MEFSKFLGTIVSAGLICGTIKVYGEFKKLEGYIKGRADEQKTDYHSWYTDYRNYRR